jgi:hypothetical protein
MVSHPENSGRAGGPVPRPSALSALSAALLFCLLCLGPGGCGYTLGSESPSVLTRHSGSTRVPTLKVKSVDNPTLYPWLPYSLRNELRNELAARNLAVWVDSGRADYEIDLKISSYTYRSSVYDYNDVTQLYSANITVVATVYEGGTNQVIWRSGGISYADSRERLEEKGAASYLIQNIVRQLADRMRQVF